MLKLYTLSGLIATIYPIFSVHFFKHSSIIAIIQIAVTLQFPASPV
jgi:hypothetical protein